MSAVLHHLQNAAEAPVGIAHRDIRDIDKKTGLIYPKLRFALFAASEFFNNFFDDVNARFRMTIFYVAADNVFAARKHAVFGIGVKADDFIFVDVGNIDRHVFIDQIDLIERQASRRNVEFFTGGSCVTVFL